MTLGRQFILAACLVAASLTAAAARAPPPPASYSGVHAVELAFKGVSEKLAPEVEVSIHSELLGSQPSTHVLQLLRSDHPAEVHFHDADGEHVLTPDARTYVSSDATFTVNYDGTFHAMFYHPSTQETYLMDPRHRHGPLDLLDEHQHVIYPLSNQSHPLSSFGVPPGVQQRWNNAIEDYAQAPSRSLLAVERWSNCYNGASNAQPRHILLGVAVDYGMYELFQSLPGMTAEVDRWVANSNMIYEQQLGVQLVVDRYEIHSVAGGPAWNWGSNDNPDTPDCTNVGLSARTDTLGDWVTANPSQAGGQALWHLITNCYPDTSSSGYAYLNALCDDTGYNVGMTQNYYLTWLTFAHEIGHNFGASHTFQQGQGSTGGIMDYGDGRDRGWYRFSTTYSQTEICSHLQDTISTFGSGCLKSGWPMTAEPVNPACIDREAYCTSITSDCGNDNYKKRDCPVACGVCDSAGKDSLASGGNQDCVLSDFLPWQSCSKFCGKGVQLRFRNIVTPPSGNGRACDTMVEKRTCNANPCPRSARMCVDQESSCGDWAGRGECDSNPAYVLANCPLSCGVCQVGGSQKSKCARVDDWPEVEAGQTVTMSCRDGGSPGSKTRSCNANAAWGGITQNTCNDGGGGGNTHCPQDGQWPRTPVGQTVSGTCSSGEGSMQRTCGTDGTWNAVNNGCQATVCPTEGEWTQTSPGKTQTKGCPSGYQGQRTRLCQQGGTWQAVQDGCVAGCSDVTDVNIGPRCGGWAALCTGAAGECESGVPDCCSQCGSQQNGNRQWMLENCCGSCEASSCAADGEWPQTQSGQVASNTCAAGFTGSKTRECDKGDWMAVHDSCVVVNSPVLANMLLTLDLVLKAADLTQAIAGLASTTVEQLSVLLAGWMGAALQLDPSRIAFVSLDWTGIADLGAVNVRVELSPGTPSTGEVLAALQTQLQDASSALRLPADHIYTLYIESATEVNAHIAAAASINVNGYAVLLVSLLLAWWL